MLYKTVAVLVPLAAILIASLINYSRSADGTKYDFNTVEIECFPATKNCLEASKLIPLLIPANRVGDHDKPDLYVECLKKFDFVPKLAIKKPVYMTYAVIDGTRNGTTTPGVATGFYCAGEAEAPSQANCTGDLSKSLTEIDLQICAALRRTIKLQHPPATQFTPRPGTNCSVSHDVIIVKDDMACGRLCTYMGRVGCKTFHFDEKNRTCEVYKDCSEKKGSWARVTN